MINGPAESFIKKPMVNPEESLCFAVFRMFPHLLTSMHAENSLV